jgi:hypothetical protein
VTKFQFSWQQVAVLVAVLAAVSYFALSGNGDKLETVGMGVLALLALIARSPLGSQQASAPSTDAFPKEEPTKKEGRSLPPPLPVFFMLLALAGVGCGGVKAPTARDATRAGVELLATALPMANELCSKSTDRTVLDKCAKAYDVGRPSLIAAAQLVDVWAGASENDKACALSASLKAVAAIVDAMRAGGLDVPELIRDAVSFAAPLLGSCKAVSP